MRRIQAPIRNAWILAILLWAIPGHAADYPAPTEGTWVVRDFRFHTGEVLPELRLHYTDRGRADRRAGADPPRHDPVGRGDAHPAFAGELFGPGQPLDATRYYVILPDAIGTGKSSKPSDGLRAKFPEVQLRRHGRRAVPPGEGASGRAPSADGPRELDGGNAHAGSGPRSIPTSWTSRSDGLQPAEMSGRNWMMRRMIIDAIRNDPGVDERQLHQAAAQPRYRLRVLRHRDQRGKPWGSIRLAPPGKRPTRR